MWELNGYECTYEVRIFENYFLQLLYIDATHTYTCTTSIKVIGN